MLTLPNVATSDKYTDACTLGPVATTQQIVFVVANAAVYCQIAPLNQSGTLGDWEQDEILLTPQSNTLQRAGGIRFRSAVAGVPAQIVAQLITPADPVPGAGTPFTAKLSGAGGVTPGTAAVQIQKNGALIGTEPILDFVTGGGSGVIADDAANTRVTVSIPRITVGTFAAGPPAAPADGDIWIATDVDAAGGAGLSPSNVQGTRWMFQYDATWGTDTLKWKFIGGPPVGTWSDGTISTSSAVYVFGTAGTGALVSATLARAGMYQVRHDCTWTINAGVQGLFGMSFNGSGVNAASVTPVAPNDGDQISVTSEGSNPAGGVIQPIYAVGGGNTITLSLRKIWITPVRVI